MTGARPQVALDTSVAVPLIMASHPSHRSVTDHLRTYSPVLTGHSLVETYSVITRLPGDARVAPLDARRLIDSTFGRALLPAQDTIARLHDLLAGHGIAGGAVYDALVAIAAYEHHVPLATRDARARPTYALLGADLLVLG